MNHYLAQLFMRPFAKNSKICFVYGTKQEKSTKSVFKHKLSIPYLTRDNDIYQYYDLHQSKEFNFDDTPFVTINGKKFSVKNLECDIGTHYSNFLRRNTNFDKSLIPLLIAMMIIQETLHNEEYMDRLITTTHKLMSELYDFKYENIIGADHDLLQMCCNTVPSTIIRYLTLNINKCVSDMSHLQINIVDVPSHDLVQSPTFFFKVANLQKYLIPFSSHKLIILSDDNSNSVTDEEIKSMITHLKKSTHGFIMEL